VGLVAAYRCGYESSCQSRERRYAQSSLEHPTTWIEAWDRSRRDRGKTQDREIESGPIESGLAGDLLPDDESC